jgi:hypothetical protein
MLMTSNNPAPDDFDDEDVDASGSDAGQDEDEFETSSEGEGDDAVEKPQDVDSVSKLLNAAGMDSLPGGEQAVLAGDLSPENAILQLEVLRRACFLYWTEALGDR